MEKKNKITEEMNIAEVVENYPQTVGVFAELGLACVGCVASQFETLQQGLEAHGIEVESALAKLNAVVVDKE